MTATFWCSYLSANNAVSWFLGGKLGCIWILLLGRAAVFDIGTGRLITMLSSVRRPTEKCGFAGSCQMTTSRQSSFKSNRWTTIETGRFWT